MTNKRNSSGMDEEDLREEEEEEGGGGGGGEAEEQQQQDDEEEVISEGEKETGKDAGKDTGKETTSSSQGFRGRIWKGARGAKGALSGVTTGVRSFATNVQSHAVRAGHTISKINRNQATGPKKLITIDIVAGRNLPCTDPYVRVVVGRESRKTRTVYRNSNPQWRKSFNFDTQIPTVPSKFYVHQRDHFGKDAVTGHVEIDLASLSENETHEGWHTLTLSPSGKQNHDATQPAELLILITISDMFNIIPPAFSSKDKYPGWLKVHVVKAENLKASDFYIAKSGSSDPFVTIELGNTRLRTATIQQCLNPTWNDLIEMPVKDIFEAVEINVYDEDKYSSPDYLGGISVPLLSIESGILRWYALKGAKHTERGQGAILLAFHLSYKTPEAYLGLLKKREERFMQKEPPFRSALLKANVNRLKSLLMILADARNAMKGLVSWEYGIPKTVAAMLSYTLLCLFLVPWHLPFLLLLVMCANFLYGKVENKHNVGPSRDAVEAAHQSALASSEKGTESSESLEESTQMLNDIAGTDGEVEGEEEEDDDDERKTEEGEGEGKGEGEGEDKHDVETAREAQGEVQEDLGDGAGHEHDAGGSGKRQQRFAIKRQKNKLSTVSSQYRQFLSIAKLVQNTIGQVASHLESLKNLLNWTVPLISALFCVCLLMGTVVLFVFGLRLIMLGGGLTLFVSNGLKKYHPKFKKPKDKVRVKKSANPLIELLARTPDDIDLMRRAQLKLRIPEDVSQAEYSNTNKTSELIRKSNMESDARNRSERSSRRSSTTSRATRQESKEE